MNFNSILIFIIVFLNIFYYTYSEKNNLRNKINYEKEQDDNDISDIVSLVDELSLYNLDDMLNCIDKYYQNVEKKYYRYTVSFQEYRDYWKPYSLSWICKKIKNNIDL